MAPHFCLKEGKIIMKQGIFIALAALALAIFAVPEAQGSDGQTLNVGLSGSLFVTSNTDDGRPTPTDGQVLTSLASGIAKGSGSSLFSMQVVNDQFGLDGRCELPLVGADVSATIVLTYKDGSILSLETTDNSFACTGGVVFFADIEGIVLGGDGRFEGATGTFNASGATTENRITAELAIDLN